MDLSTRILRSPSPTETGLADGPSQALRMAAGRDLRAPGGGTLPVTPAKFRSPAPRGPALFRARGRVDAAGPSRSQRCLCSLSHRTSSPSPLPGEGATPAPSSRASVGVSSACPKACPQGGPQNKGHLPSPSPHQPHLRPPQPRSQVRPLR